MEVSIYNYDWQIYFVKRDEIKGLDGNCEHNERVINVSNDLDDTAKEITLRHELTHAILGAQGRIFQKRFSVEDLCEFVAYVSPTIVELTRVIIYKGE